MDLFSDILHPAVSIAGFIVIGDGLLKGVRWKPIRGENGL